MNLTRLSNLLPGPVRVHLGTRYFRALNWWKYGDADFPYGVTVEIYSHTKRYYQLVAWMEEK